MRMRARREGAVSSAVLAWLVMFDSWSTRQWLRLIHRADSARPARQDATPTPCDSRVTCRLNTHRGHGLHYGQPHLKDATHGHVVGHTDFRLVFVRDPARDGQAEP